MHCRTGVPPVSNFLPGIFSRWRQAGSLSYEFFPNLFEAAALAVVVAEEMDGVALAQPAVQLVKKFAPLRLGYLRLGGALGKGAEGVQ